MAMTYYEAFDMKGSSELKKNVEQQIRTALSEQVPETFCSCSGRQINKDSFYELYGSLFFMGMYLGFMFLMVTVLIITTNRFPKVTTTKAVTRLCSKLAWINKK